VLLQDVTCPRQPGTLGATHLAHDGPASFRHSGTVIVWRDQAKHAAESLSKGSRVVVVGRLQQRAWTAEDGSAPIHRRGRGRGTGAKSALGDRHAKQSDQASLSRT
jgi:hypothetical protein